MKTITTGIEWIDDLAPEGFPIKSTIVITGPGGSGKPLIGETIVSAWLKNGVEVIHFATGFVVGYPPCPYINHFKSFIEENYKIPVVIGTHPIPEKYLKVHKKLGTWKTDEWKKMIAPTLCDEKTRLSYD